MGQMYRSRISGEFINIDEQMRNLRDYKMPNIPPPPKRKEIKFSEAAWITATRDMYKIEINQSTYIEGYGITRVPGGWIYDRPTGSVFVPFNNEGQEDSHLKL